jgi:alpha-mannosidase
VIEDVDLRTVVEALFGYRNSFLCLRYKLPKQGAEIEIEARVHWNEKDRLLKLSLPSISSGSNLLGQVAYGVEKLAANGEEVVAQKWAAVVSDTAALTVINNGTYGLDFSTTRESAGELRLTLLRAAGYAAHPILDRPLLPEDRYSPRQDQGERLFHFWLQGGPAAGRLEQVDREALAHNEQPMPLSFFPSGEGVKPAPLALLRDRAVQVTAIKKSEDGDRLVLRLFEPTGQSRSTQLDLPFAGISKEINLSPFEIRTLSFDPATKTWKETNLLEEDLALSENP